MDLILEVVLHGVGEFREVLDSLPLQVGQNTVQKNLERVVESAFHFHHRIASLVCSLFADRELLARVRNSMNSLRYPMPEVLGSDGLRARENGDYAEVKLAFLDDYGPSALDATARKHQTVYLRLFRWAWPQRRATWWAEFEGGAHGHCVCMALGTRTSLSATRR